MSINLIFEPKVRLVGRLTIDDAALDDFLKDEGVESWTTDTEVAGQKLAEVAGRACYSSYAKPRPGGNAAYMDHILEVGHGSVIEHAVYNFIITGVSRSFTHELVRHRAGFSYSQRSQRYCDESKGSFVVPPTLADEVAKSQQWAAYLRDHRYANWTYADLLDGLKDGELGDPGPATRAGLLWLSLIESSQSTYAKLSNYLANKGCGQVEKIGFAEPLKSVPTGARKSAREAARSVLPNATETQIFVTANARALRHFIEQRGSAGADAEIRRVALAMLAILQADAPNLFGDYRIEATDGIDHVVTPHPKV